MATKKIALDLESLTPMRKNSALHLLQNPNYFGTHKDPLITSKYAAVVNLSGGQNFYEALGCIAYNPYTQKLGVVVQVKQSSGYSGSPCTGGSNEFVRFFLDYDHSGTWVDEGLAHFGIYDHPSNTDLCYYAEISLSPNRASCCFNTAILPRVRAILSWNVAPAPGDPNFSFVWGDVKEADIQIAPSNSFLCYIRSVLGEAFSPVFKKEMLQPEFIEKFSGLDAKVKQLVSAEKPSLLVSELHKLYQKQEHHGRVLYDTIKYAGSFNTLDALQLQKNYPSFNISELLGSIISLQYDTTYEEIHCVSLDRDMSRLHASVEVKQKLGYLGGLCVAGSSEYVAFYMDFGGGWEYMGTSSVQVHDIPTLPAGGLWYDASLSINLDSHRKAWCEVGEAKVRAILSWNTAPTPGDPNFHAHWGDREECTVEVCPLPQGVNPGETKAVIEKLGGMEVGDISALTGLATSPTIASTSLSGALGSPFCGLIEIKGRIFNATPGTKYRFKITTPSSAEHPLMDTQSVETDTLGSVSSPISLVPDADGWLDYLATNSNIAIEDNILARYYPPQDGKYHIVLEMKDPANNVIPGTGVTFLVDSKVPDVSIHITSGSGDCADFTIGDTLSGNYSMYDLYASSFSIYVTPNKGAKVGIDGNIPVNISDGLSYPMGGLPATGKSGTFSIDTTGVPHCGYNVWIVAYDRTIVNSTYIGLSKPDVQGFCLKDPM